MDAGDTVEIPIFIGRHVTTMTPIVKPNTSLTGTGGMGLGLSIARRSIENLGGSLTIASTLNEGTTVTFTVPGNS